MNFEPSPNAIRTRTNLPHDKYAVNTEGTAWWHEIQNWNPAQSKTFSLEAKAVAGKSCFGPRQTDRQTFLISEEMQTKPHEDVMRLSKANDQTISAVADKNEE